MAHFDTIIIGGGLAGLATACYLGRAGQRVCLLERSAKMGGRARSHREGNFLLNQGPHALYEGGHALSVLRQLGVSLRGGKPTLQFALWEGKLHRLPTGLMSLLSSGLLNSSGKLETAMVLCRIARIDSQALRALGLRDWVEDACHHPKVRQLIYAMARLASYSNAPDKAAAGAIIEQLQLATRGSVRYLDGGRQSLVNSLQLVAREAGVRLHTEARIANLCPTAVTLRGGGQHQGDQIVLALPPKAVRSLTGAQWPLTAVGAACLDVASAPYRDQTTASRLASTNPSTTRCTPASPSWHPAGAQSCMPPSTSTRPSPAPRTADQTATATSSRSCSS